jgi:hypothetical protein
MKNFIKIVFAIFLFANINIFSQDENSCATELLSREGLDLAQEGGIYLPSIGNLKILLVFARFKDDNSYHPYWPAGGNPTNPDYTTWIDPNMQTGSANVENFTHYFKDMSLGVFNVTGTAVSVETPYPMAHYGTAPNMDRHLATKEVLQQKVDPLINFADFDNWTCNGNYNQVNQPDGTVDMIVMIWRVSGHPFHFLIHI